MVRMNRCFVQFVVALVVFGGLAFCALAAAHRDSAPATDYFVHADSLTDIRMPGSAPFHMTVTFHAYGGMDFSKKSTIMTGDGSYEETWLSPETWRREVHFPGYHAVEVRANGVRKYRADSDYEPSRVLMMLDALLYPVPRNWFSREFRESYADWKIEHLTAGSIPYISLTHGEPGMNSDWFHYQYSFLPNGLLVRSNYLGLVTSWEKDSAFSGKIVPLHFEIQAMGKTLLTADVAISAAGQTEAQQFQLDGPPATPGMTMRPFHMFEIKLAEYYDPTSVFVGSGPSGVIRQIIDRNGVARETELIDAPEPADDEAALKAQSADRFHPAKVDRDPCEETFWIRM